MIDPMATAAIALFRKSLSVLTEVGGGYGDLAALGDAAAMLENACVLEGISDGAVECDGAGNEKL